MMTRRWGAPFALAYVFLAGVVHAQASGAEPVPDPDPARFSEAIDLFAAWDSKNSVPRNATLFVGSSSIRLWPTAKAFPGVSVINRGFGGSELSDVIHYYDSLIRPYAPARIVLYAGDNDIASGKSADRVFADYVQLVTLVRRDFPAAELVFISIKPSKDRWSLWPIMVETNRMVAHYAEQHAGLRYADLATPLLGENGEPGDFYIADGLHLNAAGYALWQRGLESFLE